VDAAIISELLRQGHGRPYHPDEGAYLSLYQLERYGWREQASTRLKNQIIGHVDRLYPGLVINDKPLAERYQPLWRSLWADETPRRLLILYPDPRDLRRTDVETLCQRFRTSRLLDDRPLCAKILARCRPCRYRRRVGARRSTFLQRTWPAWRMSNNSWPKWRRNGRPVGSDLGSWLRPAASNHCG